MSNALYGTLTPEEATERFTRGMARLANLQAELEWTAERGQPDTETVALYQACVDRMAEYAEVWGFDMGESAWYALDASTGIAIDSRSTTPSPHA